MTPGEFWEAMEAHRQEVDADRRHVGELVRGAALRIVNLMVSENGRCSDPADFWPMPWDKPGKSRKGDLESMTQEQKDESARRLLGAAGWIKDTDGEQ